MNIWQELVEEITQIPADDPKRKRKIQAMVKRFVHEQKGSVYHRTFLHYRHLLPRSITLSLRGQYKNHYRMAKLPDDEVLTWEG